MLELGLKVPTVGSELAFESTKASQVFRLDGDSLVYWVEVPASNLQWPAFRT